MNKFILFLVFCVFMLFTSTVKADSIPAQQTDTTEQTTIQTVSSIFYQPLTHTYQADTMNDWTVNLLTTDNPSKAILDRLNDAYLNKQIEIHYTGSNEDTVIVGFKSR